MNIKYVVCITKLLLVVANISMDITLAVHAYALGDCISLNCFKNIKVNLQKNSIAVHIIVIVHNCVILH